MLRTARPNAALTRRQTTILIAVVLALATGWLTYVYLQNANRSAVAAAPVTVMIAARDIPARSRITPAMLTRAQRPADAVDPDALRVPGDALGATTRVTIPAGSAITRAEIGTTVDAGLVARVSRGMRAISIPIDRVKGVGSLLQPGDHVDVIALTRSGPGIAPRALTILRNVVVLAIGTSYEGATTPASPSPYDAGTSTATLEVTPQQAAELALADLNTTLRLDLRSPQERSRGSVDPLVLSEPAAPPVPRSVAPAAVPAAPSVPRPAARPTRAPDLVPVIDGDHVTLVDPRP